MFHGLQTRIIPYHISPVHALLTRALSWHGTSALPHCVQASGAGDGAIRLWTVAPSRSGGAGALVAKGALPQRGFINGLSLARSGRFVMAAVGQEPRMGRWARDGGARNGVALHMLRVEGQQ